MAQLPALSDATFDATLASSELPVLVDFWAAWCAPCRAMEPLLGDLAASHAGRLRVMQLNVEENPKTAVTYRIKSLPTFMLFKGGQVQATHIGAMTRSAMAAFVDKALG